MFPALTPRALATVVAVATWTAVAIHRVDPGLPFPLVEGWAIGGALILTVLAAARRIPVVAARILPLVAAGLLLRAGLPADHHATFPFVELDRARMPEWADVTLLGLLGALSASTVASDRVVARILALVAAIGLTVSLVYPVKAGFQELAPAAPGMTSVPVLGWSAPAPRRWTRSFTTGPVVTLFPSIVGDEWAVMDIAGGIHQEADRVALAAGEKSRLAVQVHAGLRFVTWRALQGVAALAWALRILAIPAAVLVLIGVGLPAARAVLRGAVYLVPSANVAAIVITTVALLPDDLGLRPAALASSLVTLALYGLVERSGAQPGEAR